MSDDAQVTPPKSMMSQIGSILLHPRATMARLIADHPKRGMIVFPLLMGLLTAVPTALSVEAMYAANRTVVWVGSLVLSVIGYWMYVYVYGGVYRMIGGWFGAAGNASAARLALAWTQVPYILSGLVMVPLQVIYRDQFFSTTLLESPQPARHYELSDNVSVVTMPWSTTEVSTEFWIISLAGYVIALVAFIWSNFLLAEALECSTWKALAVKLTAFGLHIPIFMVLFLLMVALFAALLITGVYDPVI